MARRRFSPEKKLEIVLEALKDEGKIPELLSKHLSAVPAQAGQIRLDMLEDWKQKFLEMGLQASGSESLPPGEVSGMERPPRKRPWRK